MKVNHVVYHGSSSKGSTSNALKAKKKTMFKFNKKSSAFAKKDKVCFHCGKPGHYIRECRYRNSNNSSGGENRGNAVNMVIDGGNQNNEFVAMVTEIHMASNNNSSMDWWLDSGATIHVCKNKEAFNAYKEVEAHKEVVMGNNNRAKVLGKGSVELELTSGNKLTLNNVFYVPSLTKNLISVNVLCKNGFKIVLESDKVVVTKNCVYVGKRYSVDGMFKFSTCANKINVVYVVEPLNLWHARLGHIIYNCLNFMSKHDHINCKGYHSEKCEICVQAKMIKKPFKKVERKTQLLELVHSDICELNGMLTRGGINISLPSLMTILDSHMYIS